MTFLSTIPTGDTELTRLNVQLTSLLANANKLPADYVQTNIEATYRQVVDTALAQGKLLPGTVLSTIAYSVSPNDASGAQLVAQIAALNAAIAAANTPTMMIPQLQAQLPVLQTQLLDVLMSSGRMTASAICNNASLSYLGGFPVHVNYN